MGEAKKNEEIGGLGRGGHGAETGRERSENEESVCGYVKGLLTRYVVLQIPNRQDRGGGGT
jgi:hypothetical protein